MSEFDLTKKISSFLDKHLTLPLLEYISVKNIYDEKSILKTKWEVLLGTSMVDYAADTYRSIYETEPPKGLLDKREKVLESIQETEVKLKPVKVIFSQETMKEVAQCKNAKDLLTSLETKYNFKTEMLNDMFDAARVFYDAGNYNLSSEYLKIVRQLVTPGTQRHLDASWGRLASEILVQNWDEALEDLEKLKDAIDCQNEDRVSIVSLFCIMFKNTLSNFCL
ncbi:unnamed protein product [Schistosoma curassoni]|uniref:EIF3_N domain-containing protein n=1 Tax=Schistosoma curassoni TaxID=6186 RepID=A0A183KZ00_9TREM|nr:unnamed protein product [Schistosoma curassoni]